MIPRAKLKDPLNLNAINGFHIAPSQYSLFESMIDARVPLVCSILMTKYWWNKDWDYCPLCGASYEVVDGHGEPVMIHRQKQ